VKVVVIIPTYNEAENIQRLIPALHEQLETIIHETHILVVDDGSPDGTANQVRTLMTVYPALHLITGEKKGLGWAYVRGMQHAMDHLHADVVLEMDADFSHKPEDVPRLIKMLEEDYDFVIGSRYVEGGTIPATWGLLRKLNSFFGNVVARYIAGVYKVRDCTAGFRAIRTSLLKRIDLSDIKVQGYAFQVALLNRAVVNEARIREIPVDFVDRERGESKLGLSDVVEFIINAWWIRLQSSTTFMKFSIVGVSGVIVNLGTFTVLLGFDVNKYIASPIAVEISIIWNFLFNNYWTFRRRKTKDRTQIKGLKFNAVSLLSLGVSYGTFVGLSLLFPRVMPQVHQAAGIVPAVLTNYFLNSYWTFKPVMDAD
jgi:dolichol-phosphate mannosyltransferase